MRPAKESEYRVAIQIQAIIYFRPISPRVRTLDVFEIDCFLIANVRATVLYSYGYHDHATIRGGFFLLFYLLIIFRSSYVMAVIREKVVIYVQMPSGLSPPRANESDFFGAVCFTYVVH